MKKVIVIGAGPSGLFCCYQLVRAGFEVELYEKTGSVGKKFLVAGKGGLNLTHSEPLNSFSKKYGKEMKRFTHYLEKFSPMDLRKWCESIGVETFVGTSGRVFPKNLKAAKMLSNWVSYLKSQNNFKLFLKHQLVGLTKNKVATFENGGQQIQKPSDIIICALGGASWKITGSDGKWLSIFENDLKLSTTNFYQINCGFDHKWSDYFKDKVNRAYLKNIQVRIGEEVVKSEAVISEYGVEGSAIYALSRSIMKSINETKKALIHIDFKPDLSEEDLLEKLQKRPSKTTLASFLKKNIYKESWFLTLLYEVGQREKMNDCHYLANIIKNFPMILTAARPIDEAISTSGGVNFSSLDENLQVTTISDMYVVGEMLDYDAPTGGYLLQGCFSTAYVASMEIINKYGI